MQQIVYLNANIHAGNRDKYGSSEFDLKTVNQILAKGWKVKQIVTPGDGRYRAFLLLEREEASEPITQQ